MMDLSCAMISSESFSSSVTQSGWDPLWYNLGGGSKPMTHFIWAISTLELSHTTQFVSASDISCIHQLFFSHVDTWTHHHPNFWALRLDDSPLSNWLVYPRKGCMVFLTVQCVCGVVTSRISLQSSPEQQFPHKPPHTVSGLLLYSAQMQCFGHAQLLTQLRTRLSTFNLWISFWFFNVIFMANNAFSPD